MLACEAGDSLEPSAAESQRYYTLGSFGTLLPNAVVALRFRMKSAPGEKNYPTALHSAMASNANAPASQAEDEFLRIVKSQAGSVCGPYCSPMMMESGQQMDAICDEAIANARSS
jgi:hypothetical protein